MSYLNDDDCLVFRAKIQALFNKQEIGNMRFSSKSDVDSFLRTVDVTRGISHVCTTVTKIVAKENPELFDRINDAIENAVTSCTKYPRGFVSIMWSKTGKFSQISYDASRVPKAYAFVCILKQWLPD